MLQLRAHLRRGRTLRRGEMRKEQGERRVRELLGQAMRLHREGIRLPGGGHLPNEIVEALCHYRGITGNRTRDGCALSCSTRWCALTNFVSRSLSPPVLRLRSYLGKAADATVTRRRCPAGMTMPVYHISILYS